MIIIGNAKVLSKVSINCCTYLNTQNTFCLSVPPATTMAQTDQGLSRNGHTGRR